MECMDMLLKQIHQKMIRTRGTVAAAESCTGGMLSAALTSLSGSSAYFLLGTVVYSNGSKSRVLGIRPRVIADNGAVSDTVCRAMAQSVRQLARSGFGLGITGIAGPSGAVPGKPVGTVFIGISAGKRTVCRRFLFKGGRASVRRQSCEQALRMLAGALKIR